MDEAGTDEAKYSRKVASGRRVAGAINGSVLECARVLHESLLVPVLMYGSETMLWKEKDRSKITAVQMNNLRGLLGIRKMDRVPKARIRELCGVTKDLDKRIDEGGLAMRRGLRWTGLIRESMLESVLVLAQWVDRGRDGLIP